MNKPHMRRELYGTGCGRKEREVSRKADSYALMFVLGLLAIVFLVSSVFVYISAVQGGGFLAALIGVALDFCGLYITYCTLLVHQRTQSQR